MSLDSPDPASQTGPYDLSLAAAQLAANGADLRVMLKVLIGQLTEILGDRLQIERAGRFRKTEEIESIRIAVGDDTLDAQVDGPTVRCTIGHSSGGIRIRSEQVGMAEWLTRLLGVLQDEAEHSERARQALERIVIGDPT
jgi:hypothetical protein